MKVFSIGFEQRQTDSFLQVLKGNGILRLVDVRCFPEVDSAGFAKGSVIKSSLQQNFPNLINLMHSQGASYYQLF